LDSVLFHSHSFSRNTVPLHKAAQRGQLECQRILIGAEADINFQDEDDITPLHRALYEMGTLARSFFSPPFLFSFVLFAFVMFCSEHSFLSSGFSCGRCCFRED
jgi:hypothetical protein